MGDDVVVPHRSPTIVGGEGHIMALALLPLTKGDRERGEPKRR